MQFGTFSEYLWLRLFQDLLFERSIGMVTKFVGQDWTLISTHRERAQDSLLHACAARLARSPQPDKSTDNLPAELSELCQNFRNATRPFSLE
jgi:hypothetical protein